MFSYLLEFGTSLRDRFRKFMGMTDEELEDLPLFLKRTPEPPTASRSLVQPQTKPDDGSPFNDDISDVGASCGLSEQDKPKTRTVKFQKYDEEQGKFVSFEREFTVYDSPKTETPYYRGFLDFKKEDFLSLGADKLYKLCPYKGVCYESTEWWRGFYSSARWYWYDKNSYYE